MTLYKDSLELVNIFIAALAVFSVVVVYTRAIGLVSFAKISSMGFATTIAIGSIIASIILPSKPSFVGGCFGMLMIFMLQWITSFLKTRFKFINNILENKPVIIMKDGKIDFDALKSVNMSEAALIGKLREANVFNLKKVSAVVFESTGDVSVLHSEETLDDYLLSDL